MQVDDIDGAAATAWYFLKTYDYMRATGDTAPWEAMTTDDCGWCATVLDKATSLHESGGWIEGPGLSFDITTARVELPDDSQPFYVVRLNVVEEPFRSVRRDGTVTEGDGNSLEPMAVAVQFVDGRFLVVGVNYEEA